MDTTYPVHARVDERLHQEIEAFRRAHDVIPGRAEALRRLIEAGLKQFKVPAAA